jgi:hypothetical protein
LNSHCQQIKIAPYASTKEESKCPTSWTNQPMGIGGYLLGKLSSPRQMGIYLNQGPVDLAGPT